MAALAAWDRALEGLGREYLVACADRLGRMDAAIARLAGGPRPVPPAASEAAVFAELTRDFHSLAGSGGTYGLPEISRLGADGERRCRAIGERGPDAHAADLASLRRTVEAMRAELAEAAGRDAARRSATGSPFAAGPPPRPAERSLAGQSLPRGAEHVLVVEPDARMRRRLIGELEEQGFGCRAADNGAAALASVNAAQPAALVVGAELPDGSGYALVDRLRSLADGVRRPILLLGPPAGPIDRVEAIHCGADGYAERWMACDTVAARLRQLLAASRGAARILSVEDDPAQAAHLRTVLEAAGYEVRTVADPATFEDGLIAFEPDLLLLDIQLPGLSGYDLAKLVRQDEARLTLPIVFLTARGELDARLGTARAGGDDHLVKPVDAELLLSAVATRLERSRRLKGMLDRDGLTRLLNHAALLERARAAVAQTARQPRRRTAWLMLDVDRFKSINDRHGHPAGDRVLSALGALLTRRLRPSDAVGRYGGEEFAILVDDLDEDDAVRLANRLREEFHDLSHAAAEGAAFHASFSAGIAFLRPGMRLEEWRERSDRALYRAKAAGRNRVVLDAEPAARGGGFPGAQAGFHPSA